MIPKDISNRHEICFLGMLMALLRFSTTSRPRNLMKFVSIARLLLASCIFAISTLTVAGPTLLLSNGVLTEAKNVNVAGTLYDVKFALGSCNQLFNGCAESAFAFHTNESAQAAARALLEQIYVDGPEGNFGSWPYTVQGCNYFDNCVSYVPYGHRDIGVQLFVFARAIHFYSGRLPDRVDGDIGYYPHVILTGSPGTFNSYSNFAVFTRAAEQPVPEPASLALFGLALTGVIALRRRRD